MQAVFLLRSFLKWPGRRDQATIEPSRTLSVCSGLKMKRQSRTLRLAIESYPIGLYRPAAKNSTIGR